MELSQGTKNLLAKYQAWYQDLEPKEMVSTISVDEVAARVASFYEQIRGVVDWREEHLLRKTAIERILKRRVMFGGDGKDIAEPLLQELIRGGHFPNNRIPATKIEEIQEIINKYISLIVQSKPYMHGKFQAEAEDWLLTLGACEIEENLSPRAREHALIEFMAQDMEKQIQIRKRDENRITPEERALLIFVGVQRSLFKLDDPTMSVHMLEKFYPDWNHLSLQTIALVATQIQAIKTKIDSILYHPLAEKFYRIIERHDTPYLIIGDIISQDPGNFLQVLQTPQDFEAAISRAYANRLRKLKSRMSRAAFFSTVSVFLSKVLIAILIEYPIDTQITHEFNLSSLLWSIAIPPAFLLFLVATSKSSSKENVQKVLLEVTKITYESDRKDIYEIAFPRKRNIIVSAFLNMVYLLSFVLSYGILIWVLKKFHFSALSIAVFLIFFSLIVFAATRIRSRSKELIVGEEKEGFLHGIFEFFGLPIIQVGKWLSSQIARFNILVILLNVLIEVPFQIFVEFIEQIRTFWQEKKDEMR